MVKTQNDLVKELFSYLDTIEISDSGREFHPISISCCRVMKMKELSECIEALKASITND